MEHAHKFDNDAVIPMQGGIKKQNIFSKLVSTLNKDKKEELCDLIGSDDD